jgi:glyoxylase-like metal-dependent hydrolase (beta-lactamase superfamily II)
MRIGDAEILTVVDDDGFALPLGFLFPGAEIAAIEPERATLAPDHVDYDAGTVRLALQSHVVRADGLTILVDTCVGEHKERPRRAPWHRRAATGYLERLARLGVAPQAVDVVLCTHLHADHIGWNTRLEDGHWVPTFPRARYLMGRTELAHWQALRDAAPDADAVNHGSFDDSVLPVVEAGRADLVEGGHPIGRGLTLLPLPGHSPGQLGLKVEGGGEAALLCGDAIHSPVQVYQPRWSSAFCDDPEAARVTRVGLLEDAAEHRTVLVPAHLRGAMGFRVDRRGNGFAPRFCGCAADGGRT